MKERGILFSAPMVRALLAGAKTVTRRIVKVPPGYVWDEREDGKPWPWYSADIVDDPEDAWLPCPYGKPGDRLYVKEAWGLRAHGDYTDFRRESIRGESEDDVRAWSEVEYRADWGANQEGCYWRPSIVMPRWASRITLEVVSVRVERLHEITEADAWAEGIEAIDGEIPDEVICARAKRIGDLAENARTTFSLMWDRINGERAPWSSNPWVWRVEFKRVGEVSP